MNILVLGNSNKDLSSIIKEDGHKILEEAAPIDLQYIKERKIDFAVSYGYRHIVRADVLNYLKDRIINLYFLSPVE